MAPGLSLCVIYGEIGAGPDKYKVPATWVPPGVSWYPMQGFRIVLTRVRDLVRVTKWRTKRGLEVNNHQVTSPSESRMYCLTSDG